MVNLWLVKGEPKGRRRALREVTCAILLSN
jgi:hypothetical protein